MGKRGIDYSFYSFYSLSDDIENWDVETTMLEQVEKAERAIV